jgi:hypothetical protein
MSELPGTMLQQFSTLLYSPSFDGTSMPSGQLQYVDVHGWSGPPHHIEEHALDSAHSNLYLPIMLWTGTNLFDNNYGTDN